MSEGRSEHAPPADEWRTYRVDAIHLGPSGNRVLVTAHDEAGELLAWTAQPDRVPRIGLGVNVTMHAQTNPPLVDESGSQGGSDV